MPIFKKMPRKIDMDQFVKDLAKWTVSMGLMSAAAGAGGAAVSKGLDILEDRATRRRNKIKILQANPDLAKIPKERFDMYYNTIRRSGLGGDPLFASEAIKRIHNMPEAVVGMVPELVKTRRGLQAGASGALASAVREQASKPSALVGELEPINIP